MEQNTANNVVAIENVAFTVPDENLRQYRYVVYPTDTPEMMDRTSDHGCG